MSVCFLTPVGSVCIRCAWGRMRSVEVGLVGACLDDAIEVTSNWDSEVLSRVCWEDGSGEGAADGESVGLDVGNVADRRDA